MGFKKYSTERVIKAVTYELTENDEWSVKGKMMGECWYKNCCVLKDTDTTRCRVDGIISGNAKIESLIGDTETQRIMACVNLIDTE